MIRWICSRVLAALLTLAVASVVVFGSLKLVPGDPLAAITSGTRLTPEQKDALREKLGLDQDFFTGYITWISGILQGDLGQSLIYGTSVNDLLAARVPTSVTLIVYAAVLTLVFGIGIALISATRPGIVDRIGLVVTSLAVATPSFVIALILLAVFAVQLQLFPATGAGDGFLDVLYHLTLPAFALAFSSFGLLARVSREKFREELASEHVEVARSRGVNGGDILSRHVVRNSLGPVMTLIALMISALFIGTAIVETAFGVDGMGQLLISSIARRDFPVVQAISLISVTLFVVTGTVAELLMPLVDPRVRTVGALR